MDVIDEEGRLFGLVNVIDALVVLLVLAVVVAGFALVDPFASTVDETRYATIDLGEHPGYVAEQIEPGDVSRPETATRNVTVTDVYVGPAAGENVSVVARARINGTLEEGTTGEVFTYDGTRVRSGLSFALDTDDYTTDGTITRLSRSGTDLETETRRLRIEGGVSPATADRIATGDSLALGDHTYVTLVDVHLGPGDDASSRSMAASLTVEAIQRQNGLALGSQQLSLGQSLSLDLGEYTLRGVIEAIGGDAAALETHTTGVTLATTVSEEVATRLEPGDTYQVADSTVATIEAVRQYPGPNDDRRQLYLGVSVTGTVDGDDRYFGPDQLSIGQSVPFRTGEYAFSGTIEAMGEATVETTTTEVALETTVSTTVADAIEVGDAYRVSGAAIATVQSIDTYPTGDDTTRRVLLGLDLQTVDRESGQYFGTRQVTLGSTVPFETASYGLSGTVVGEGSYTPAGSVENRTISVRIENVSPEFADGIETGMTEQNLERTTARILEKRVEPASTILTSEDGNIFERDHPRNKDVTLTVEVAVRETNAGYQFHAQSLKEGNTITLDFRTISVDGTVTDIRTE